MKTAVFVVVIFCFLRTILDAVEFCHIVKFLDWFARLLYSPIDWLKMPAWQNFNRSRTALPRELSGRRCGRNGVLLVKSDLLALVSSD